MTQLRKVKYKLENSKTSKVGFFHIFKKNISENGSEIVLGIIEDEKTGNLFEIQIANFSFTKEDVENVIPNSISKNASTVNESSDFIFEDDNDDLPFNVSDDFKTATDKNGNIIDFDGNIIGHISEQPV